MENMRESKNNVWLKITKSHCRFLVFVYLCDQLRLIEQQGSKIHDCLVWKLVITKPKLIVN